MRQLARLDGEAIMKIALTFWKCQSDIISIPRKRRIFIQKS